MSELSEAVQNLRNMRETYDQLGAAAEAYNTGKLELAANITAKGVQASATETLPELAEKVTAIAQQPIIMNDGDVANMYAKQLFGASDVPNYWNLYHVLNDLLNDGRLMNYGGILLAEYYKGYDSLTLTNVGAGGAYVVSDIENGVFKMYTEDVTHIWNDANNGKGNRWVAYCFANEYHDFQIADTNTSPRSIYIGRKVGTITYLVNGRLNQIVVSDGNKLKSFVSSNANTLFAQNWGSRLVLRNIEEQTGDVFLQSWTSVESMYIQADKISGTIFQASYSSTVPSISSAIVDCPSINGKIFNGNKNYNLKTLIFKNTSGTMNWGRSFSLIGLTNLMFIDVENISTSFENIDYITKPSNLCVYIGYKDNDKTKSVSLSSVFWNNVYDVRLKEGWCKPLNISTCVAVTEANMYANILQRLKQDEPDCGDGVTITLGSTNLAKLTSQESIDLLDALTNTYGYTFA